VTGAARTSRRLALVAAGLLVIAPVRDGEGEPRAGVRTPHRAERVHVVKAGESLPDIAKNYGVSVKAIVAANKLKSAHVRLRVGQRLVIPTRRLPAAERALRVPFNMVLSIPDFDGRLVPFEWPVEGTVISQFGRRRTGWHRGLDIKAEMGTPVLAAAAGVVTASGVESRYGKVVKIEHANHFVTVYAHHL
jgi:murein DD-endopeptidase MepM/ murein hydrolase activator NlpD